MYRTMNSRCGSGLIPEPLIINWVDFSPTLRVPYMKFCSLSKANVIYGEIPSAILQSRNKKRAGTIFKF